MSDVSSEYNFIPRRGLRRAHLQTIAGNFLPRTNLLPRGERRVFTIEEHESGAKVQVVCVCHWQKESGDRVIGSSGEVRKPAVGTQQSAFSRLCNLDPELGESRENDVGAQNT